MEGGALYGNVLGFYARTARLAADLGQANARLQALMKAQTMKEVTALTSEQVNYLQTRVAHVDKQLKERFDKAYAAWKSSWSHR